jgi:SNF2 family DNA or RNA helicase
MQQTPVLPDFAPILPTWTAQFRPAAAYTEDDYQAVGTAWLVNHTHAILGDEMGLGKSKQFLDAVRYVHSHLDVHALMRVLVVCKKSNIETWVHEIERFDPMVPTNIYHGTKRELIGEKSAFRRHYTITTYETYRMDAEQIAAEKWDWVVLDEAHVIRSNPLNPIWDAKAKKFKSGQAKVAELIHNLWAPRMTIMTGTPLVNAPEDAWNLLHWLEIDRRSWPGFVEDTLYIDKFKKGNRAFNKVIAYKPGGQFTLRRLLKGCMLRRLKEKELDLPPKIYSTRYVTLNAEQQARYDIAEEEWLYYCHENDLDPKDISNDNVLIIRLKQITSEAKTPMAIEIARDAAEDGAKAIIFTQYRAVVTNIWQALPTAAVITGDTVKRQHEVDEFQTNDKCKYFIGSVQACREGLTLTAASLVIHVDKEWSPAMVAQAEDRAHRIGQHNSVQIITLQALKANGEKTIDAAVSGVLHKKRRNIEETIK